MDGRRKNTNAGKILEKENFERVHEQPVDCFNTVDWRERKRERDKIP